jgi:hypothetical protein
MRRTAQLGTLLKSCADTSASVVAMARMEKRMVTDCVDSTCGQVNIK